MKMFSTLSLVFLVTLLTRGCDCQSFACGSAPLNTKIVGGQGASSGSWPWQVSLHQNARSASTGYHFCGGSLINNQWILSAAHCFPGSPNASIFTVYLGRQSQELPNPNEMSRSVVQVIVHPQYNDATHDNDMALLLLSSPVTFSDYIQPVCLAGEGSTFNSDTMWVTGWGTIASGVSLPSPQILQEVQVPLVGNTKCNCLYSGGITNNMMCAGAPQGGKDSCQGDSGGPMVIRQGSTWVQAGVVSFGQGCALPDYPGVYARVSNYQNWITQTVGMNNAGFIPFTSLAPSLDETCPSKAPVCGGNAGLWPWMASVTYENRPVCVGTLVSELFVMTTVSCFARFMGTDGWEVVLNVVQPDCTSMPIATNVANVFFDDVLGNGLALLQLSNPFSNVPNLPVDIYNLNFGPGTPCSVIGWDSNAYTYLPFHEMQTTIVSCDPSQSTQGNICTEPLNVQQDDDGSPLLCMFNGMVVQAGILSIPPGSVFNPFANSTEFIQTNPFSYFMTNTINSIPSILDGAESFSPLSLTYILLLSLPAVLQAFY